MALDILMFLGDGNKYIFQKELDNNVKEAHDWLNSIIEKYYIKDNKKPKQVRLGH